MINTIYKDILSKELDSDNIDPICKKKYRTKWFAKNKEISVHDINPKIFNNYKMIEFTPLYFKNIDSTYYIGLTYYCGLDCGQMTLFKLKNRNDKSIIQEEIEVGEM